MYTLTYMRHVEKCFFNLFVQCMPCTVDVQSNETPGHWGNLERSIKFAPTLVYSQNYIVMHHCSSCRSCYDAKLK